MIEAIGEPKVLRERCKRLAAKEWAGKTVTMRAKDKDGMPMVAVLDTTTFKNDAPSTDTSHMKAPSP